MCLLSFIYLSLISDILGHAVLDFHGGKNEADATIGKEEDAKMTRNEGREEEKEAKKRRR